VDLTILQQKHPRADSSSKGSRCKRTKLSEPAAADEDESVLTAAEPSDDAISTSSPKHTGLTGLVDAVLGVPVDKRQQISNWHQRPLSRAQQYYAACDAVCLLEIYVKRNSIADSAQGRKSSGDGSSKGSGGNGKTDPAQDQSASPREEDDANRTGTSMSSEADNLSGDEQTVLEK